MANQSFGAKDVMNAYIRDITTKKPVLAFKTLKTSAIDFTTEKVKMKGGRGNATLATWEINKEGKFSITDAALSPKCLELVSGIARKVGVQTIYMRQDTEFDKSGATPVDKGDLYPLTATSGGAITLAYTPKEAATAILVYDADDDCGTPLAMTGATLVDEVLTVSAAASKKVVVYYSYNSTDTAETYEIDATHMAGTYELIGDTVIRNIDTGKDEGFQVFIPNLKWTSNLTLNFAAEGEPSPVAFDCEIQRSASASTMIKMVKY